MIICTGEVVRRGCLGCKSQLGSLAVASMGYFSTKKLIFQRGPDRYENEAVHLTASDGRRFPDSILTPNEVHATNTRLVRMAV